MTILTLDRSTAPDYQRFIKYGFFTKDEILEGSRNSNGSYTPLFRYCDENKIILRKNKQTDCKKRELVYA